MEPTLFFICFFFFFKNSRLFDCFGLFLVRRGEERDRDGEFGEFIERDGWGLKKLSFLFEKRRHMGTRVEL